MESDFSIRNELDSVVRGTGDAESAKYSGENPFSKIVDAFSSQPNKQQSSQDSNVSDGYRSHVSDVGWKAHATFASAVAQQQADIAHRAIDVMYRSLGETKQTNYWKYVAIASLGVLVVVLVVYWRSNVNLRLVQEPNSAI